jgi:hypothetical protein
MKDTKISWTGLFFVTSVCFFSFSLLLKVLDGVSPGIFLWIGSISLVLGLLNGLLGVITSAIPKDEKNLIN